MAKFSKKVMGKEIGDAAVYAKPHTMSGKPVTASTNPGKRTSEWQAKKDWSPMDGFTEGQNGDAKTTGIKIRGTGCATKGVMARGPMA
jgi:hypothetical protein